MKTSDNGIKLIRQWEGVSKTVYLDSVGLPTIGCGHLLTRDELTSGKLLIGNESVKYRNGLTDAQIDQLLKQDLIYAEKAINDNVKVSLSQNQFDALCSFAFNVGVNAFSNSTLLKLLNSGGYQSVASQLRRWNKAGGNIIAGLTNRREKEVNLFYS